MTRSRIRDVFSRRSRVSALFSALPAISAARRLSHSTGKKILATNYTFFTGIFGRSIGTLTVRRYRCGPLLLTIRVFIFELGLVCKKLSEVSPFVNFM